MAKKSMKAAATAGTSVFAQIASGNVQNAEDVNDVQDVQDAQDAKAVKNVKDVNKEGVELARLNLKIPAKLKEYLTIAAAKASIEQRRNISLTQYLCDLVTADMERHKDQ
jgi:hypothetical protein